MDYSDQLSLSPAVLIIYNNNDSKGTKSPEEKRTKSRRIHAVLKLAMPIDLAKSSFSKGGSGI